MLKVYLLGLIIQFNPIFKIFMNSSRLQLNVLSLTASPLGALRFIAVVYVVLGQQNSVAQNNIKQHKQKTALLRFASLPYPLRFAQRALPPKGVFPLRFAQRAKALPYPLRGYGNVLSPLGDASRPRRGALCFILLFSIPPRGG